MVISVGVSKSWSNREEFLAAEATGAMEIDGGIKARNAVILVILLGWGGGRCWC